MTQRYFIPATSFAAQGFCADGTVGMPDVMFIVNYILKGKYPDEE